MVEKHVFNRTGILRLPAIALILMGLSLATASRAEENDGVLKEAPDCIFVLHCEPSTANNEMFAAVVDLVELARNYKVKLTFEFTPQWAEMILADEEKLAQLRKWQKEGHEVGAHHHPLYHPGKWDQYTDIDPNTLGKMRIDLRGGSRPREEYLGNMADFMKILNRIAAPEQVVTGTFGRPPEWAQIPISELEPKFEIPEGILYEAEGFKDPPQPPRQIEYRGRQLWRLPLFFVDNDASLNELCEKYTAAEKGDIVVLVTHAFNFHGSPDPIEGWLKFLQSKDPEGKHNKTVFQVMKEYLATHIGSDVPPQEPSAQLQE